MFRNAGNWTYRVAKECFNGAAAADFEIFARIAKSDHSGELWSFLLEFRFFRLTVQYRRRSSEVVEVLTRITRDRNSVNYIYRIKKFLGNVTRVSVFERDTRKVGGNSRFRKKKFLDKFHDSICGKK